MAVIVTTSDCVPGREAREVLGVVCGNVVRARFFASDIVAGLRNLIGGEVDEYTKLLADSRRQAYERMVAHAEELKADAVVCFRFASATVMEGSSEILAYGTAVRLE